MEDCDVQLRVPASAVSDLRPSTSVSPMWGLLYGAKSVRLRRHSGMGQSVLHAIAQTDTSC